MILDTIKHHLTRAIWWLRHRTTDRFHILNLSGMDGYTYGWLDRDHAMELACWKCLIDYVEQEDPEVGLRGAEVYQRDEDGPLPEPFKTALDQQIQGELEIRALYTWWTQERPALQAKHEAMLPENWYAHKAEPEVQEQFAKWNDEKDRLELLDDAMLMRLVAARKVLWT